MKVKLILRLKINFRRSNGTEKYYIYVIIYLEIEISLNNILIYYFPPRGYIVFIF